jgi:hypothetical protein
MARRRKSWADPPTKTVFGTATSGIKLAINTMARQVVSRFRPAPLPTVEALKMVIHPDDMDLLRRVRGLMTLQQQGHSTDYMLKFDDDKGSWAGAARLRLRVEASDPDQAAPPDYCAPSYFEKALGKNYHKGNLLPTASFEHTMALEHGVRDYLEVAHDWAMVEALFNYFDSKPEVYKRSNVRFLWSGIMPLLRMGGESCQNAAILLAQVKESGWCHTPPDIFPALKHANEVIARGQLLIDQTGSTAMPPAIVGYAMPHVMCSEYSHPQWPLAKLTPKLA